MNNKYSLKILQVVGSLETGGIEKLVYDLVSKIDPQQFHLEICCVRRRKGQFLKPVLEKGIPVHFFGDYRKKPQDFFPRYKRFIGDNGFDVVHSHMNHWSGFFIRQPCKKGVPLRIVHYHNDFTYRNKKLMNRLALGMLGRITDRYANQIVGISDVCLESVYGPSWKRHDKIQRIYNGIDLDRFSSARTTRPDPEQFGINPQSIVIGHVGQFRPQKNHLFIVNIAEKLCERFAGLVFFLIGDGPLLHQVQEYVVQKGLVDNFIFTGARTDVPALMQLMDFFVYPSLWEGFGLAVVEAQAAGLPVVASDRIPVEIPLGKLSRRISLDKMESWVEACENLIQDKNIRTQRFVSNEEQFKEFSIETWVKKIETLYVESGDLPG